MIFGHFSDFGHFPIEIPIEVEKSTHMGRKGPRAKTKSVLKSVSKVQKLGSMPNLKFQTFLNKNHPAPLDKKTLTRISMSGREHLVKNTICDGGM